MELFLLCLKIFFARIMDVSLGTIRTNYSVRGNTILAGIIGFFEIFIWFLVVQEALNTEINSLWIVISYSSGYAVGTIFGTFISKTFINGLISIEVITSKATTANINKIRNAGFGVSVVNTKENYKNTNTSILFITLNSKYLNSLKQVIKQIDPKAFIVINETKIVQNGYIK